MKQETIGIIGGKGEFGAAFAEYFRLRGYPVLVASRRTELSVEEAASRSDIVILSVPISKVDQVARQIAPHLRADSLLMDFCSVKEQPLKSMLQHFAGEVIGCHPMFGPRNLQPGQTVVFCPGRGKTWYPKLKSIFQEFKLVEMDSVLHDRAMSLVQGVQHFMENAYAKTIADYGIPIETLLSVSSPVYRIQMGLVGRILSQDEKLYGEICYGSQYSREAIGKFRDLVDSLAEADRDGYEREFLKGRQFFGAFCQKSQAETDEMIDLLVAKHQQSGAENVSITAPAEIGTLGPQLTWSDLAAAHFFPDQSRNLYPNFPAIIAALESGEIEHAFLPLENKISGTVRANWDAIAEAGFWLEAAYDFPISHVIAAPGLLDPETIFGHSEALAQCRKFLEQNYPHAKTVPVASNSEALTRARSSLRAAAICSPQAAKAAGFTVLKQDIADKGNNWTRFGLVSRQRNDALHGRPVLTSLFFELKNVPGSLFQALQIFSRAKINLVRLESRPCGDLSEFGFFAEADGIIEKNVLKELEAITHHLKILGEYSVTAIK